MWVNVPIHGCLEVETDCSRLTRPRCSWRCGHAFRGGDVGSRYVRPFIPEEADWTIHTRSERKVRRTTNYPSISWWRGETESCGGNEVWLVFDLACLFFGFFSGWISCYIIFLRHHGLSGSETSWAYFGTSIKIQGPKWFHELWELRVTESFWKWISDQTSSNLTWCLSDDCTKSKTIGNCTLLSGRYVWSSWSGEKRPQVLEHDLPLHIVMSWVTFGFKQVESHPIGDLPTGPCIILHHFCTFPLCR